MIFSIRFNAYFRYLICKVILFWRVTPDSQDFLPCSRCHISIHVLFLTNFCLWARATVFVNLMISHHFQVKLNSTSRQDEPSLSDNAKKQSNTMGRLMSTKKQLIGLTRSSVIFSEVGQKLHCWSAGKLYFTPFCLSI